MARKAGLPAPLALALRAAMERYRGHPDVLGIALGFKYRKGKRAGGPAVQFFVRRKFRAPSRRLPRFVLGRGRGMEVLRSVRIPTDVVAIPPPRPACGAGTGIRAFGERGSIALLFRDRGPDAPGGASYMVTCAHVAGSLDRSPPLSPELRLAGRPGAGPFAVVIKNTVAEGGVGEYDAALARISDGALPVPDLTIEGGGRIAGWLEEEDLELGMTLEMSCASGRRRGVLESLSGEFLIRLDGRPCRMRNLYGLRAAVRDGDSGGLVHARGRAAGMVVARSVGGGLTLTLWQPLKPALTVLNRLRPRTDVRPFHAHRGGNRGR